MEVFFFTMVGVPPTKLHIRITIIKSLGVINLQMTKNILINY